MFVLCAYKFDALGEYDKAFNSMYAVTTDELLADHPKGAALKQAMDNFRGALKKAEKEIEAANANGLVEYGAPRSLSPGGSWTVEKKTK